MVKLWDYFMRRKLQFGLLLIAFLLGGIAGSRVFYQPPSEHETEYISISNWGDEVEIPHTGIEDNSDNLIIKIMSPKEIVALAEHKDILIPNTRDDDEKSMMSQDNQTSANENISPEVSTENLDHLEEPVLLESAVMEVLPPANNETESTAQIELADDSNKDNSQSWWQNFTIMIMAVIVVTLNGDLVYWHFRR